MYYVFIYLNTKDITKKYNMNLNSVKAPEIEEKIV